MGSKCNKCPYKREAKGDLATVDVMTEARVWNDVRATTSQEMQVASKS